MTLKVRNPASGKRQGFAVEMVSKAGLTRENSPLTVLRQGEIDIVGILAARTRVAIPTARLFAELHGFGGANA